MTETIKVVFSPITSVSQSTFGLLNPNHETAIYTNAEGVVSYSMCQPVATAGESTLLVCAQGTAAQVESALHLTAAQFADDISPNYSFAQETSETSLASKWTTMGAIGAEITGQKNIYDGYSLNSNTGLTTEMSGAGVPLPANTTTINSPYWAPGSGNILSTPQTTKSTTTTDTSSTSGGVTTIDVTDKNSAGTVLDTQVFKDNSTTNAPESGTLTATPENINTTETFSVVNGVTTETISGTAPDTWHGGSAVQAYDQTITTNAAGAVSVVMTSPGLAAAELGPVQSFNESNATITVDPRAQINLSGDNDLINMQAQNIGKGGGSVGSAINIMAGTGDTFNGVYGAIVSRFMSSRTKGLS